MGGGVRKWEHIVRDLLRLIILHARAEMCSPWESERDRKIYVYGHCAAWAFSGLGH